MLHTSIKRTCVLLAECRMSMYVYLHFVQDDDDDDDDGRTNKVLCKPIKAGNEATIQEK